MYRLLFLIFIFVSTAGFSQSYLKEDPAVVYLKQVYIRNGLVFPLNSFPVSDNRFRLTLEAVLPILKGQDLIQVSNLLDGMKGRGEKPYFQLKGRFSLLYSQIYDESDWPEDLTLRDYLEREPLMYLGASVIDPDKMSLYLDIGSYKKFDGSWALNNIAIEQTQGSYSWSGEIHDVRRGVVSITTKFGDFSLGRDKIQYGPGDSSLVLDPDIPWVDCIRSETYLGNFTLSWRCGTLFNDQAANDVQLSPLYQFDKNTILNSVQRFQYTGENWQVGLSDNCYFVHPSNAFQLADIFPVFSWHNADFNPNNNSMMVDATVVPVKGVEITGQIGFDDINARIFGIADSATPTIDAEILTLSLPDFFNFSAEVGHTHYLWGSFDDDTALARAIYRVQLTGDNRAMPMTSPYGPGSIWLKFRGETSLSTQMILGMKMELVGHKTGANLYNTPYENSQSLDEQGYSEYFKTQAYLKMPIRHGLITVTPGFVLTPDRCNPLMSVNFSQSFKVVDHFNLTNQ